MAKERRIETAAAIHIWQLNPEHVTDEALSQAYRALLTEAERAQELRFRFPAGRKNYLLTRSLARTVLSRYSTVQPHEWNFSKTEYGRPEIAPTHTDVQGLSFNISHTEGAILLGVTRDRALGIDVENLNARSASLDLARRVFAPQEIEALSALPEARQRERFLELWTLKESYIKARGMGLAIPTRKFGFDFVDDRTLRLAIDPDLQDDAARWSFVQFRPSPEHIAALCFERGGATPRLEFTQIVPLRSAETLECPLGRRG